MDTIEFIKKHGSEEVKFVRTYKGRATYKNKDLVIAIDYGYSADLDCDETVDSLYSEGDAFEFDFLK